MRTIIYQLIAGSIIISLFLVQGCRRPNLCSDHISKHVLKRMDKKVKDYSLTDIQKGEYAKIRAEVKKDLARNKKERIEIVTSLKKEFEKKTPDTLRTLTELKTNMDKKSPFISNKVEHLIKFYNILDDNQKKKFNDKMKRKLKRVRCKI